MQSSIDEFTRTSTTFTAYSMCSLGALVGSAFHDLALRKTSSPLLITNAMALPDAHPDRLTSFWTNAVMSALWCAWSTVDQA